MIFGSKQLFDQVNDAFLKKLLEEIDKFKNGFN